MVKELLECRPIVFTGRKIPDAPDKPGIYLLSNRTGEYLYVGTTNKDTRGISERLKDHWDGSSSFANRLARDLDRREWLKENVLIRWLTEDQCEMGRKLAEQFAIAALRPKYNKAYS